MNLSTTDLVPVLMLFLIPVGGGIPAGVLLARTEGLAWPITMGLYFISDIILAFSFEPVLWLLVALGKRVPIVLKIMQLMKQVMAQNVALYRGRAMDTHPSPITLILIAFGVDPMTGRAAAMAAGHGFIAGWAIAIAGDMMYYSVIAFSTLQMNSVIKSPEVTMMLVLMGMIFIPKLIRKLFNKP